MISFKLFNDSYLDLVMKWRTKEHVTKYMATDIEYNIKKQKIWYNKIKQCINNYYWIIHFDQTPIGLISMEVNEKHKYCLWAYYIGEKRFIKKVGGIIPLYLYNFIFSKTYINKIIALVMMGNENVRKLHLLQGYNEIGVLKDHIFKNFKFYDVYHMELYSSNWHKIKYQYMKYQADFETGNSFTLDK